MKEIRDKLYTYNELKAKVKALELDIEEMEEEIINQSPRIDNSELMVRVQTSHSSDITAKKAIKLADAIDWYKDEKRKLEREIERIENSLRVLNPQEYRVITMRYFEKKSWTTIQLALNCTYSNVKRIESEAIGKIRPYLRKTVEKM